MRRRECSTFLLLRPKEKFAKEKGVRPAKKLPCFYCGRSSSVTTGFSLTVAFKLSEGEFL